MKPKARPMMAMGAMIAAAAMVAACGSSGGSGGGTPVSGEKAQSLVEDALAGKGAVECAFADEDMEGLAYIKANDVFRFDGVVAETEEFATDDEFGMFTGTGEISMLTTGGMMYMWEPGNSEGMAMDISAFQDDEMLFDVEELRDEDQFDDMECKRYTGSDSIFTVPGDVEFMDLGSMFSDALGGDMFEGMFDDEELANLFEDEELAEIFGDMDFDQLFEDAPTGN